MVRHCSGQMSMQASHSMHLAAVKTVSHVAVQAALDFTRGLLGVEAELHFDVQLLEPLASDRRASSSGAPTGL